MAHETRQSLENDGFRAPVHTDAGRVVLRSRRCTEMAPALTQPDNTSSLKLITRLGFRREGYSTAFQFINGAWRDHEHWTITAEARGTAELVAK